MIHILGKNTNSALTNLKPADTQPNATDLRIGKVFKINTNEFIINEESKVHRGSQQLFPDASDWFHLDVGAYEIIMENEITVGADEAGWVVPRSSLNRNGVFITSGLYDSGYKGVMAGVMHVECGPVRIQKGTRVAQFVLFKAEALSNYNGSYGAGSTHDQKYK